MKNNKAFTLIELLAVIVILAIIALIATPIVLNIIKDSKENTIKISAENYLSALDNSIALNKEKIKDNTYDIIDKGNICLEYNSTGCINELKVRVEGTIPESGTITVEKGIVVGYELVYREKIVKKESNGKQTIDENPYIEVMDNNPGIICGDSKEKEDLSLEVCHIRSIEDLVAFSNPSDKSIDFSNKTIKLVNSLDFKNKNSYVSGKVNLDLIRGVGFSAKSTFKGIFEGNNNIIKGLYMNKPTINYIALFGYIDSATIQNLNIEKTNIYGLGYSASLVGYNNEGIIQNINLNNINILSSNTSTNGVGSLIGTNKGTVKNIEIDKINLVNETGRIGGLLGTNSGIVKNIKASNISVVAKLYSGGLIATNSGNVKNVEIENIDVNGKGEYLGGLIGVNNDGEIENIKLKNISINNDAGTGGLIGLNATGTIKNIVGENIIVKTKNRGSAGLIGGNNSGSITQIKLTNVYVEGNDYVGGLAGSNETGTIQNVKVEAKVKGGSLVGLIVGTNGTGIIKNIVTKGNAETNGNIFVDLIGYKYWDTSPLSYISGVNLTQNLIVNNRETKTLIDMGKASQSEYEAIGFEFESTDTNECYWYFDDNDELDLKIK